MKTIILTELPNWRNESIRFHAAPLDLSMCQHIARIEDGDIIGMRPDGQIQFMVLREGIARELEGLARPVCRFAGKCGGAKAQFAEAHVYTECPGLIARCASCGHVLLRLVNAGQRVFLDVSGMTYLRFER